MILKRWKKWINKTEKCGGLSKSTRFSRDESLSNDKRYTLLRHRYTYPLAGSLIGKCLWIHEIFLDLWLSSFLPFDPWRRYGRGGGWLICVSFIRVDSPLFWLCIIFLSSFALESRIELKVCGLVVLLVVVRRERYTIFRPCFRHIYSDNIYLEFDLRRRNQNLNISNLLPNITSKIIPNTFSCSRKPMNFNF